MRSRAATAPPPIALNVDDEGNGHEIARDAVRLIELTGAEPCVEVRQSAPQRQIVQFAAEAHASLIVVGSRGSGGARALGSVSERVAHRASCSVLVVRQPDHGEIQNESVEG